MSLRYLMLACLMGLGFQSVQGMKAPDFNDPATMEALLKNPKVQEMLKTWAFEYLNGVKGEFYKWVEQKRDANANGIAGKAFSFFDQAMGRKEFPIAGDDVLGEEFNLEDWHMACVRGEVKVIKHFLAQVNYSHLLNRTIDGNKALSWAAFGYLDGEKIGGVVPNIEGFKLLVQHNSIESNFLIRAGMGRIAFDEWLLHEASYPKDSVKQARLTELKTLLLPTLSPERLDEIKELRENKESEVREQEKKDAALRTNRFNKISFVVGALATCGAIYYYLRNKAAAKPSDIAGRAAAAV